MTLFIYLWLCWVFVAVHRLSLVAFGAALWLRCMVCSLWWLLVVEHGAVGHTGLSSCGAQAQLPCSVWNPP